MGLTSTGTDTEGGTHLSTGTDTEGGTHLTEEQQQLERRTLMHLLHAQLLVVNIHVQEVLPGIRRKSREVTGVSSQQGRSRGRDSPNGAGPGVGTLPTGQVQGWGISQQGRSRGGDSPNRTDPGVGLAPSPL